MKIKLIIGALFVVAMVGIASASYNMAIVDPAKTVLIPGDTTGIIYGINLADVTPTAGDVHSLSVVVTSGTPGDLLFEITDPNGGNSGWISAGTPHSWVNSNSNQQLSLRVMAITNIVDAPGSTYAMKVAADGIPPADLASATTYATAIPEFPTIALPVAAILGLAFIFQRRKEEE